MYGTTLFNWYRLLLESKGKKQ